MSTKQNRADRLPMEQAAKMYRLPGHTTREDLEHRWDAVLNFGDKVLLAGYYDNGRNAPCYFGAVYEYLTDDRSWDDELVLAACSGVEFYDNGHAIAWAMQQ